MKYLLDTHTLLWYLNDDENLSEKAHKIRNCAMCRQENFLSIPVTENHIECIKTLDFIHRNPFDRLLIAIAQAEDMTIVTRDTIIPKYPVSTLW